jgi:hypothetical protein
MAADCGDLSQRKKTKEMGTQKLTSAVLLIALVLLSACEQPATGQKQEEKATETKPAQKTSRIHSYGGWYCPDNLGGFPPVNIADLAGVPVVNGRMPSQEETRNGSSLMYFDPAEFPDAKPLNIKLPKLAHYYANFTKQLALVIVIQAVVVDADTIVGFRYVDGGNGSSWYNQVDFLSDSEIAAVGATPFVFLESEIKASKEKIWSAITKTAYAKELARKFEKQAFFASEWTDKSRADFNYKLENESATGNVMTHFGNIYMQIDYDFNGRQAVEKILIMDKEDGTGAKIQVVFGPYAKDISSQQKIWEAWIAEVMATSEKG